MRYVWNEFLDLGYGSHNSIMKDQSRGALARRIQDLLVQPRR